MSFEDLQKANETIKTLDVMGKEYAEVNQRIKAFRMLYPEGTIETEMLSNENGVCVFKASVYANYTIFDDGNVRTTKVVLGTGHAYEKENSTFINKTSYIENCETSAVGRALAMCGIGIDTSVASAEEVQNAINNQVSEEEAKAFKFLTGKHKGKTIEEIVKEDEDYLIWWLDQGKDEKIKQMITLITGLAPTPIPNEEEQQERFNLLARFQQLLDTTNSDYDKLLKHYGVHSNADLTNEQLKDAIGVMEKKQ
jgi:hypothetical protein